MVEVAAELVAVLAREPAPPDWQQPVPPRLDCRPTTARYLVAVEVAATGGTSRVDLRILDLDDRAWAAAEGTGCLPTRGR